MSFIFWQNIISPHQSSFLRELSAIGHDVVVVASEVMTPDRLAMGWQTPNLGRAKIIIAPDAKAIRQIIETNPQEAVHVLAGARWTPLGQQAMRLGVSLRRKMGIMSEAPDPRGLAGIARHFKYTSERLTIGRNYDFILAMGEMGVRWFQFCGYPSSRLFPYSYVTEPATLLPTVIAVPDVISICFVGRFVSLKGVDLLLRAFALLKTTKKQLLLVGEGPEEATLRVLAHSLGISASVEWLGKIGSAVVPSVMAKADLVVLPSRKDGWGAVVNESLMVGTPVVCSDACGATELMRHPWLGTVFHSGDVKGLAGALQEWAIQGRRTQAERQRIQTWSGCIEGARVAGYFAAIMSHVYNGGPRPAAPWRG